MLGIDVFHKLKRPQNADKACNQVTFEDEIHAVVLTFEICIHIK